MPVFATSCAIVVTQLRALTPPRAISAEMASATMQGFSCSAFRYEMQAFSCSAGYNPNVNNNEP
jgi:hypothetical protein